MKASQYDAIISGTSRANLSNTGAPTCSITGLRSSASTSLAHTGGRPLGLELHPDGRNALLGLVYLEIRANNLEAARAIMTKHVVPSQPVAPASS